jgi:hypothetical protein
MERSWLVQRLRRPWPGERDNPFSFGGGLKNGGLSDEAMGLLRGIFSFDYMGAAEFEFGAVPEALQRIARADLAVFSFAVPLADVPAHWRDKSSEKPAGEATVYVLCPADNSDEVRERIEGWARTHLADLKEQTRFASALRPFNEWDSEVCGWLELDNGFMFFTDRDMWQQTCELFGVTA